MSIIIHSPARTFTIISPPKDLGPAEEIELYGVPILWDDGTDTLWDDGTQILWSTNPTVNPIAIYSKARDFTIISPKREE